LLPVRAALHGFLGLLRRGRLRLALLRFFAFWSFAAVSGFTGWTMLFVFPTFMVSPL